MKCVVGIDGGGTKTLLRGVDMQGNVICEAFGGSSNLCSNSEETVQKNLKHLFQEAGDVEPAVICIGSAGISGEGNSERLSLMLKEITGCTKVLVVGDMETALAAEVGDGMGILVISGTGAIAFGRDKSGRTARCDGWGHLIGDEGSSYWVAVQGLRAAMRGYDGRADSTILTKMFADALNVAPNEEIISQIYKNYTEKSKMASLAPIVDRAAGYGDAAAYAIMEGAGECLFSSVKSVSKQLSMDRDVFTVIMSGGLLLNSRIMRNSFDNNVKNYYPFAETKALSLDAAWGAVKLGFSLLKKDKEG